MTAKDVLVGSRLAIPGFAELVMTPRKKRQLDRVQRDVDTLCPFEPQSFECTEHFRWIVEVAIEHAG